MDRLLFFFITGALSSLLWPALLPAWGLPLLLFASLVCMQKHYFVASGTVAGVLWMSSVGYWLAVTQPEESLFSQRILVTGEIVSVVTGFNDGKFDFVTETVSVDKERVSVDKKTFWQESTHKIRLSWRQPDFSLAQGQKLQLEVKLKPRWGLANEAGFDYQQWQLSKNIVASGYVVKSEYNVLLHDEKTFRQTLAEQIADIGVAESRWLLALGLGYRNGLTDRDWQLLQATGTSHLVAISGMHLGMVALWSYLFFVLVFALVRAISGVCLWRGGLPGDIRRAALTATLLPCFFYALLAGFSVPTLRAFVMLVLAWCLVKFNISWRFHRFILVSVACFVVMFPLSIFSISFWLSFSAILIIAFMLWRFPFNSSDTNKDNSSDNLPGNLRDKLYYFIKLQLGVTLLMVPLVILLFGGASLVSPLVNIVAVPLVTLVLLPLSLIAIILMSLNSTLAFDVLNLLLRLFLEAEQGLNQVGSLPYAWFDFGVSETIPLVLAALAWLFILMPKTLVPRGYYLVLLLPLSTSLRHPEESRWQLDVLDVGQGLSIMLRKDGHGMLYDTGAAFSSGFSMANAVVLPILKKSNIGYLDKLIISHDDNDHAGGLDIIRGALPVADFLHSPDTCHNQMDFQWRGLQFDILWPVVDTDRDPASDYVQLQQSDNNLSCVIKVSDGKHSFLLAGDIEYSVERLLVDLHRQQNIDLRSDFLVVPHHGSKTSSTASFINAVSPQYALVSAGFRNRWRMPAEDVLARYRSAGVRVINTAETGQISLVFSGEKPPEVSGWRINQHLRWYLQAWQQ